MYKSYYKDNIHVLLRIFAREENGERFSCFNPVDRVTKASNLLEKPLNIQDKKSNFCIIKKFKFLVYCIT